MFIDHGIEEHGLKRLPCQHCPQVFHVKEKLVNHEMTHTGEVKYYCDLCGFKSRFSGNYYTHKKKCRGFDTGATSSVKDEVS
jgi:RNase P subunit RPR2